MPEIWVPNGSKPSEPTPGFGWVQMPDYRDTAHPAAALMSRPLGTRRRPRVKGWATLYPPLDQGTSSECVVFTGVLLLCAERIRRRIAQFPRQWIREKYLMAQERDPWPGTELTNPPVFGTDGNSCMKVFREIGLITSWGHAFTMEEAIDWVNFEGPFAFGSAWWTWMDQPDGRGVIRESPTGRIRGGHEYAVVGIDNVAEHFIIQNSWGPQYGIRGRARIPFMTFERLFIREIGDAIMPVEVPIAA